MSAIPFYKYQAAGNDFVIFDNRDGQLSFSAQEIARICHRQFGIGADGIMLLETAASTDFKMVYFNADGAPSSMCGNGGRALVAFAHHLGLFENSCSFMAVDGLHQAKLLAPNYIALEMQDYKDLLLADTHCFLDTGSPHHIEFVAQSEAVDVVQEGRKIRYAAPYGEKGANVNFVEVLGPKQLQIATYERGVENETLACGTGVTAAAIAHFLQHGPKTKGHQRIEVRAKGGDLAVEFDYQEEIKNIWLLGPAQAVFQGQYFGLQK